MSKLPKYKEGQKIIIKRLPNMTTTVSHIPFENGTILTVMVDAWEKKYREPSTSHSYDFKELDRLHGWAVNFIEDISEPYRRTLKELMKEKGEKK